MRAKTSTFIHSENFITTAFELELVFAGAFTTRQNTLGNRNLI